MLDVLGKSYVIDHCIAFFERKTRENNFREYVGNALYVIAHNTAAWGGSEMAMKYTDMYKKPETRTAEEIKDNIKQKLAAFGKA